MSAQRMAALPLFPGASSSHDEIARRRGRGPPSSCRRHVSLTPARSITPPLWPAPPIRCAARRGTPFPADRFPLALTFPLPAEAKSMNPFAAMTDEDVLTRYYDEENDDQDDCCHRTADLSVAHASPPPSRAHQAITQGKKPLLRPSSYSSPWQ